MPESSVIPKLDYGRVERRLVSELAKEIKKRRAEHAVIGLSGGLDSSVAVKLLSKAVPAERIVPVFMPYSSTADSSREDAFLMAKQLRLRLTVKDISPQIDAYFRTEKAADRMRFGNKCARERMSVLYDISMKKGGIVIGTSNRSEITMGYGTLFGDLACAVNPLGSLFKTQIFGFAAYLGIPERIIAKKPSADLWKGQTDEDEMGISYETIDSIAHLYFDRRMKNQEIRRAGFSSAEIKRVVSAYERNSFKREMPYIIKL